MNGQGTNSNIPTPNPDPVKDLLRERFAMSSLLEFARLLTPDLGPVGIIKTVLRTIMGKGLIPDSFAYLSKGREDSQSYELVTKFGFRTAELPHIIRFEQIESWLLTPPEKTKTTIPIFDSEQQEIIGFLGFGKSLSQDTDISQEKNYLESLALLTGIALTNASLFEAEKERERFQAELRLAREIQQSLLPQKFPEINGLAFTAFSKQSELVGGDYYDVIKLNDNQAFVAIADVVGKGISAAILMSNLQASLHALISQLRSGAMSLQEMVKELNRLTYESTVAERYITGVFAIIDSTTNRFSYIVCGHPKPIISSLGKFSELATCGIPLGIIPNYDFEMLDAVLPPDSYCALYTDGLSEAMTQGTMLGFKGVAVFLQGLDKKGISAENISSDLFQDSEMKISDDITLFIIKILSAEK
jgi:sigma-B regulation protein RsbU (phosphoserine phosphatase)